MLEPFTFPATLHHPTTNHQIPVLVLLDSGAPLNLIDAAFLASLALPTVPMDPPLSLNTLDGSGFASGPASVITTPVKITVSVCASHVSLVATKSCYPIVLGLPWFVANNPNVDWPTRTLSLPAVDVVGAVAPVRAAAGEKIDLPAKYGDFADVFDPHGTDVLPQHRQYDCAIDLVEGAVAPWRPIYNLSLPEQEALRTYVDEALQKGFIRHSKSPAGASLMFVAKKSGELRPVVDYRFLNAVTVKNRY